jgi:hypothetical protein
LRRAKWRRHGHLFPRNLTGPLWGVAQCGGRLTTRVRRNHWHPSISATLGLHCIHTHVQGRRRDGREGERAARARARCTHASTRSH